MKPKRKLDSQVAEDQLSITILNMNIIAIREDSQISPEKKLTLNFVNLKNESLLSIELKFYYHIDFS